MYTRNPDFWVVSPGCHVSHLHSNMPSIQDEDEDGAEGFSSVCHHTGYPHDVIRQAVDAPWSSCEPPTFSGICSSLCMIEQEQSLSSSENPRTIAEDDQEEMQHFVEGCCWNHVKTETHQCVDLYEQRDPEGMSPFWGGSPLIYYGMMRNVVVGVDVVEEVAVEDVVEVITGDVFADGPIEPEFLQEEHLYPT
ncbi:hypothetical protein FQA47_011463 [Oryzias melastigma]|uniref:Uncharacterized protein n=1 Tax=Oryzias melastigma TaxID=30732 RepID=A0A834FH98_ORYME|nr:hypothetical protein FQA47_011463 [Oryzias melastigma]